MSAAGTRSTPPWMIGCLLVAAALRLFRIGHQPLWIDEMISLQLATYAQGAEFWRGLLSDIHGPFNSALLHGWILLGDSEGWLRSLYVIPAVATIPFLYRFVRDLFDEPAGRAAAWVLAISPFHVWYSQEIRSYSWAILWTTITLWLFLRIWDGRRDAATWMGIAVTLSLSLLSNFSLVFLLVATSALIAVVRPHGRSTLLRWGGVLLFAGLVFLPWFLDWFSRMGEVLVTTEGRLGVPLREAGGFSWSEIPYVGWSFAFGYSLGPSLQQLHLDRSVAALLPYAPVLLLGALTVGICVASGLVQAGRRNRMVLVLGFLFIPLALAVLLATRNVKTFHPRYLIVVFPVFLALVGVGWSRGGRVIRTAGWAGAALMLVALGQHYFDPAYAKEDSRSAARFIAEREAPGDSVVVIYSYRPFRHYFSDTGSGQAPLHHVHKRFLRTDEEMRSHVADASEGASRVWLVLSRWWDVAPEAQIRRAFEESLQEQDRWEFPGVKVTLYEGRRA
ncbi:MAG: hypothetical protein DHS20C21_18830 [Gemmatimonadota bacterium]|nr:MAG: hypothetical protein DHS20C21_18830 [Gemmatimonadota bacterium]